MGTTQPKLQVTLRADAKPADYCAVAQVMSDAKLTVLDWLSWRTFYEMKQGQSPKGGQAVLRFKKCQDDPGVEAVVQKLRATNAVADMHWET
jgi:hypothetical protein